LHGLLFVCIPEPAKPEAGRPGCLAANDLLQNYARFFGHVSDKGFMPLYRTERKIKAN
jgi:hypothetical protein